MITIDSRKLHEVAVFVIREVGHGFSWAKWCKSQAHSMEHQTPSGMSNHILVSDNVMKHRCVINPKDTEKAFPHKAKELDLDLAISPTSDVETTSQSRNFGSGGPE
jgi:hypothetical protein